jgi:hypothetical protein
VSGWTFPTEPTLDDIRREFTEWEAWRGVSGLYYARPDGHPRAQACGEDPLDLRDQIIKWVWMHQDPPA